MAKSLTIKNKQGEDLYPISISSLVYNRFNNESVELTLNNLISLVSELQGVQNVFFGGIVGASTDIATDYSNNGYSGTYLYMVGTNMSSLVAYQYNGNGTPTQLFSGATYDFTDFTDVKQEVLKIKSAINILLYNLGEYCFPNGRPTINWDGSGETAANITTDFGSYVTPYSGSSTVNLGSSFTTSLTTSNNMYVIDPDSVVVMMDSVNITSTAYNSATDEIYISNVSGNVTIEADAITYIGYGESNSSLVSIFDGKNRGGVSGEWTDLMDNTRKLILTNCTEASDHVELNGSTSTALAPSTDIGVEVQRENGTIEGLFTGMLFDSSNTTKSNIIFANKCIKNNGAIVPIMALGIAWSSTTYFTTGKGLYWFNKDANASAASEPKIWEFPSTLAENDILHVSVSEDRAFFNGNQLSKSTKAGATIGVSASDYSKMGILSNINTSGTTLYKKGIAYCVRIYNTKLTAAQAAHNYFIDQKRFNLQ